MLKFCGKLVTMKDKIILLNDTIDLENWGGQAGAYILKQIMEKNNPNYKIVSITYKQITKNYYKIKFIKNHIFEFETSNVLTRISELFEYYPRTADEYDYYARKWLRGEAGPFIKNFLKLLPEVKTIFYNGEGSVYRNNNTAKKALFMLWFARMYYNVPFVFLNGTVHLPDTDPILPAMVKKTFNKAEKVFVRENYSLRNLQCNFPTLNINMVPDSAFLLHSTSNNYNVRSNFDLFSHNLKEPYVCLSIPVHITKLPGFYTLENNLSGINLLIEKLKKLGRDVVIMGKEYQEQFLFQVAKDNKCLYFGQEYNYEELIKLLSNADFLISGRYHHIIFASIVGCPVIPFRSSSFKIDGLWELLEMNNFCSVYDFSNLRDDMQNIVETIEKLIKEREQYSSFLKNQSLRLKTFAEKLTEIVKIQ